MNLLKHLFPLLIFVLILSCSRTVTPPDPPGPMPPVIPPSDSIIHITASMVSGWWGPYADPTNNPTLQYPRLYFGADSFYLQPGYGFAIQGNWHVSSDSLYIFNGQSTGVAYLSFRFHPDTLMTFHAGTVTSTYIKLDSPQIVSTPIITILGDGTSGYSGNGGPSMAAETDYPSLLAVDPAGNIFVADASSTIRKINAGNGQINLYAGILNNNFFLGDGSPAISASIHVPGGMTSDKEGNILITDNEWHVIRKISASDGSIRTIAGVPGPYGDYAGDGGPATAAQFVSLSGIAVDDIGNIFAADYLNSRIRKISAADGTISTIAGTGVRGNTGDGGPAVSANIAADGLACDGHGNIFVFSNSRIRRIDAATGLIQTICGGDQEGYNGEGVPASGALLSGVSSITIDALGNIIFSEAKNHRVRKIDASDGKLYTIAGNGSQGFSGDGRHATAVMLNLPAGVAVNGAGDILIADLFNNRVRKVSVR